jgi:hypothetical protein
MDAIAWTWCRWSLHIGVAILVSWGIAIVLRNSQYKASMSTADSTDINSQPFGILHVWRELFGAGDIVLSNGGKAVLIDVGTAVGDSCI